jgi:predicted ATPase
MLVVLDNCGHVLEAAAGLVAALVARCPRVRFLATSRERLDVPGEMVLVEALAVDDARHMAGRPP